MALPGTAVIPATMRDILSYARLAGRKIMELVEKGITPSKILTKEAFENAIIVHSAIGGSTNATLHLPAIARELGIELTPELFDEINHKVPAYRKYLPKRNSDDGIFLVCRWNPDGTEILKRHVTSGCNDRNRKNTG